MSRHVERKISLAVSRRLASTTDHAERHDARLGRDRPLRRDLLPREHGARARRSGALLFLLHSILDGCDGELARLKFQESRWGGLLDFWGDNVVHVAVFAAMAVGWSRAVGAAWPLALGALRGRRARSPPRSSSTRGRWRRPREGPLYTSVSTVAETRLSRAADALSRRDFIYLVLILSAFGKAAWFLVLTAVGAPVYFLVLTAIALAERRRPKECLMTDRTSFYPELAKTIAPAQGKLAVLLPGLGAVSTTLIAGVHLIRKGLARPFGSRDPDAEAAPRKALEAALRPGQGARAPRRSSRDLVFGGWDIFPTTPTRRRSRPGSLSADMLSAVRPELESVRPMSAVFERAWVKNLDGPNVKKGATKMDLAEALVRDIEDFRKSSGAARAVMVWCGSTEVYAQQKPVHETLAGLREGPQGELARHPALDDLRLRARSRAARRTPTAPRTSRSTSRRSGRWPGRGASRSPARTSRPARR